MSFSARYVPAVCLTLFTFVVRGNTAAVPETVVQLRRPEKDTDKESTPFIRIFGGAATPDQNGAFVLRNLAAGRYQFDPRFFARYWYLQSMTVGATAPAARIKLRKTAETQKTEIELKPCQNVTDSKLKF